MYKRGILILWTLCMVTPVVAQVSTNFSALDKSTYEFYVAKDWKNLITYSKWGLHNHIDYYYLRMRLGIAYYEQQQYRNAIVHFRKALEFNMKDPAALEYLYYSYLFSGRKLDARSLVAEFSPSLSERLNVARKKGIRSFSLYNTYRWNPEYGITDNFMLHTDPALDGWQQIEKNLNLVHIRFEHQVANRITLYHGYSYLTRLRFIVLQDNLSSVAYSNDRFNQYQIFLMGSFSVSPGFSLNTTVHYLNLRPKTYPVPSSGGGSPVTTTYTTVTPEHNCIGYISGRWDAGPVSVQAGLGYSNLNKYSQFQQDLSFALYPLGNLNFYSVTKVSHQSNYNQSRVYDDHFIITQTVGCKIFNPLWVEFAGSWGEIANFYDYDATVVYNDMNPVRYKAGMDFIIPFIRKGIDLTLGYTFMDIDSRFFVNYGPETELNNPIQHVTHSITGGIKWNISGK